MTRKYRRQTMFKSRLSRREDRRQQRQAILLFLLSGLIVLLMFFYGIAGLTKLAVLLTNIQGSDRPIEILDQTPPLVPQVVGLPDYTNEPAIGIAGFAEPGSTIKMAKGELVINETLTTTEGRFKFSNVRLEQGENNFTIWATDSAGNDSLDRVTVGIIFDNEPPILEIDEPKDGTNINGDNRQLLKIIGRTETGVDLRVNDRFIITSDDGNFIHRYPLVEGENELEFVAKDKAGNETIKSLMVHYAK